MLPDAAPTEGSRMASDGRPRISVVNDNADFLELMSAILDEDAGYEVTLFNGDETTIDELAGSEPDLIIVDLLLGGASGWEVVTLARADERLADTPLVVCSADVTSLRERAGELAQIANLHVLEKPFSVDEITDLVEKLVGRVEPATR
ncbi:MAG TPA: response regulator [Candidatus Limnocylindrales bacterium]|nr:response regulator [Candidatus Limnocylindrales bacterium]